MRVAVLGATGIVATAVVDALRNDPDKRVDAVVALSRRPPIVAQPHVDWRQVDFEHDDLGSHLVGVDAVVNLGHTTVPRRNGKRGLDHHEATLRMLDTVAGAGVRHIVQGSTFLVYSPAPALQDPVTETWPIDGVADTPFVRARVAAERAAAEFAEGHQVVRIVRLRAGLPLGPEASRQLEGRLGALAAVLRVAGRLPVLPGIRGATVPAVHHDDLAAAYRLAVTGSARGPYNVALDAPLDLEVAARALGARPLPFSQAAADRAAGAADRAFGRRSPAAWLSIASRAPTLDSSRARDELGWRPAHALEDAVRSTLQARR